jgi:hypothetical protein
VLLALIGKRWRGERDGAGPRILEAGDFVRQEVAAGLAKGLRVIPMLLDGVAMPEPAQLPPDLGTLAGRNALELDNTRFAADMAHLVREVRGALGDEPAPPPTAGAASRTGWWIAAAVVVGAAAIATFWQSQRSPAPAPVSPARAEPTPAPAARAQVNGEWQADVTYDWDNARFSERFTFAGEADELHGSASFLGVARGVLEGRVDAATVVFVTRTSESSGGGGAGTAIVHRYRGRLAGDELRFVMQTEGGSSTHVPVEFIARRVASAGPPASR